MLYCPFYFRRIDSVLGLFFVFSSVFVVNVLFERIDNKDVFILN